MNTTNKLKAILKETGWSQEEFARRLNVSHRALNFWITGKSTPREQNIQQIDQYYEDIIGRSEISPGLLRNIEQKALATSITIDELLTNQELLKTTTLYLTYHTNTIEGSTMTISDVQKVLDDENVIIPDRTVKEQMEARNHRTAFEYLLSELKSQGQDFRWSSDLIRSIHQRLMNGIMESAGFYRLYPVRIIGSKTKLADFTLVSDKVEELVNYMNAPYDNLIERLAVTHATFEQIHPFGDGNGRTGRLIMFAQALQSNVVPPLVIKERKNVYYKYLENAQINSEYDLLRLFVAESILFTDDLIK